LIRGPENIYNPFINFVKTDISNKQELEDIFKNEEFNSTKKILNNNEIIIFKKLLKNYKIMILRL